MYKTLLKMWKQHKLTETQLENAVIKGWITQEDAQSIIVTPR